MRTIFDRAMNEAAVDKESQNELEKAIEFGALRISEIHKTNCSGLPHALIRKMWDMRVEIGWNVHIMGGVCSSVIDTNPRGVGGGFREGGAGSKILLHFGGIFGFPISF